MFEKLSCSLALFPRLFWKRYIIFRGKASNSNHRQRAQYEAQTPSIPQLFAKEIPLQVVLSHLSYILLFLRRSYQRQLFLWVAKGIPFGDCCSPGCKVYLVTESWDDFPWGANYSWYPPTSSWIFQIWLWHCWFVYVPNYEQCIMDTAHAPLQANTGCLSDLFISGIHASKGKTQQIANFSSSLGFYNHILLVFLYKSHDTDPADSLKRKIRFLDIVT